MKPAILLRSPLRRPWLSISVVGGCLCCALLLAYSSLAPTRPHWTALAFSLAVITFLAASLWRLAFAKEELWLDPQRVLAIEVRDEPEYLTNQWQLQFLGFGRPRLTIDTADGVVEFGRALDAVEGDRLATLIRQKK